MRLLRFPFPWRIIEYGQAGPDGSTPPPVYFSRVLADNGEPVVQTQGKTREEANEEARKIIAHAALVSEFVENIP